jgi:hypothetical protein
MIIKQLWLKLLFAFKVSVQDAVRFLCVAARVAVQELLVAAEGVVADRFLVVDV